MSGARSTPQQGQVRVIGGDWRRSPIHLAKDPGIRPTPARVRETLFNWLQYEVPGARVLELFAGSGILSLEALSRGAAHATTVDRSHAVISAIGANLSRLGCTPGRYELKSSDALDYLLSPPGSPFDIIFLDPPFNSDLLEKCIGRLQETAWVKDGTLVYVESGGPVAAGLISAAWTVKRQKQTGQVHYSLYEVHGINSV